MKKNNSISIGLAIRSLLKPICETVEPVVVKGGTSYPYIIYQRTRTESLYHKISCTSHSDEVLMDIVVYHDDYGSSVELAEQVREKLEKFRGIESTVNITDCRLQDSAESAEDSYYYQLLKFEFKIGETND